MPKSANGSLFPPPLLVLAGGLELGPGLVDIVGIENGELLLVFGLGLLAATLAEFVVVPLLPDLLVLVVEKNMLRLDSISSAVASRGCCV